MADKIIEFLIEWAKNYFKSRDAYHKNIVSMEKEGSKLVITFKDSKEFILAISDLSSVGELEENMCMVTLNNRKNVEYLYNNWSKFIKIQKLKIFFINPLSSLDKKWIINPYVHSRICDESVLKLGLMSMFETVEPMTEEILNTKL